MGQFKYQARDAAGAVTSGVLSAGSADEATAAIRAQGMTVVDVSQQFDTAYKRVPGAKKIKRDDVIFFATQLAVMVDTGVPLDEGLEAISSHTENPAFKYVLEDVSERVKGGTEFSSALEEYPRIFDNLFVSLMKASEASGTMGEMLQRASEYMESDREIRKRIKGAMTYPVCMLSFCVVVVVALLVFILPRFEKIYSGKGAALPIPTQFLLSLSNLLVNWWHVIIVCTTGIVVFLWWYGRTPAGRITFDKMRINMPGLGSMFRKACLARSLRTMATMVGTGVGILDGLAITSRVAGNSQYSDVWDKVAAGVQEGQSISDGLLDTDLVPGTVTQMISAGERTGKLGKVMNRVARFCEDDMKVAIKAMTSMIEPVMIIVMGLLVGGIAMALLLPVFKLSKVVAK